MADWKDHGSLLTASCPMGSTEWEARSKDLDNTEAVELTAYAIGIKHKTKPLPPMTRVFQDISKTPQQHVEASVVVPAGYTFIGGGARAEWATDGHYLVGCYPKEEDGTWRKWNVESWDHLHAEFRNIVGYAIGVATQPRD